MTDVGAIVTKFHQLVAEGKFQEAVEMLADDFSMSTPKGNYASKKDWIERFPKEGANGPIFEKEIQVEGNKVIRKGSKKIGFMTFHVNETNTVNDAGQISKIEAVKALQ